MIGDKKLYLIYNRNSSELVDTIIATRVRKSGNFYDFFIDKLHASKVNCRNFYYEEMPLKIGESKEKEIPSEFIDDEDRKIYYNEFD